MEASQSISNFPVLSFKDIFSFLIKQNFENVSNCLILKNAAGAKIVLLIIKVINLSGLNKKLPSLCFLEASDPTLLKKGLSIIHIKAILFDIEKLVLGRHFNVSILIKGQE